MDSGVYDSYADKAEWDPSERLHDWVAGRVLDLFAQTTNLDPASSTLLEVGTGTGRIAKRAVEVGWSYTGVEPTTALRKVTTARYGVLVHDAALPHLPSEVCDFDAALALHVLEHAPDPYAARAWLAAMRSSVRPKSGYVLIASPDIRDYGHSFYESDWSHGWPTTPHRISDLMADVGLVPIMAKTMRLGSLAPWTLPVARLLSMAIPTRPIDNLSRKALGRPLATGLKISMLWGLSFVVGRRSDAP